jgi:hypothetical protein
MPARSRVFTLLSAIARHRVPLHLKKSIKIFLRIKMAGGSGGKRIAMVATSPKNAGFTVVY